MSAGYPVDYNPRGYPVSTNPAGSTREPDLDTSRTSQASYGSRNSGTVNLGGSDYPIGSTVGSSGLFVIGDPGGKANRSTDSVRTSQTTISQYSAVVGGELKPSKGYDFEDWNWPVIRCSCLVVLIAIMIGLLTATIATAIAAGKECDSEYDWWQGNILYHLSVSEFYDSNGNYVGDLKGIENREDYFEYLGVKVILLKNFMASVPPFWDRPVSYIAVDDRAGTIEDFGNMINKLHQNEIKVMVEINAAFTSEQHEWFEESQKQSSTSDNIYTNVYNWKDSVLPADGPNWHKQPVRNQFYQYDPISNDTLKPLLNWDSTRVQILIEEVMEFWLKLGVDGFYMPNVRHYSGVDKNPGKIKSIISGWTRLIQTFSDNVDAQKRVLMMDGQDLDIIRRRQPDSLLDVLEAVNLVHVPLSVDSKNITANLIGQIENGIRWQEDYIDHPDAPWVSFALVNMSRIQQRHLAIIEFCLFYLPGSPILQSGQEVGRDPEDRPPPGVRVEPMSWSNDRPYESGSILDVSTLSRFVTVIKSRDKYISMRGGGYTLDDTKYRGFEVLSYNKDVMLLRRTQYQEKSIFFGANFGDVSVDEDWSDYTSYGSYIVDSSDHFSGNIQLNDIELPKETAVIFSDII